jgi:hypothetical protein
MNLYDFYPKPKDLIANEINTLKFLSGNNYIRTEHNAFWSAANQLYTQSRGGNLRSLDFSSYINIRHAPIAKSENKGARYVNPTPNLQIVIGGLVSVLSAGKTYENISYALIVGGIRPNKNVIMRKFHFDITTSPTRNQPHPICHLQYCGSMWKFLETLGYKKDQLKTLHMHLSEPRIFLGPMSLALLLDMIFREFPDNKSIKFIESPEWKNVIRANEKLLLSPFHQICLNIINSNEKPRKTLADEFYVV